MSEPAAPYAASPSDPAPTCAPADRPQTRQAGRRCFDHACPVAEGCPLYQRRAGPPYGPVACSWRHGWECTGERCAVQVQGLDALVRNFESLGRELPKAIASGLNKGGDSGGMGAK